MLHPRTKKLIEFNLLSKLNKVIIIRPACGYIETINFLRKCNLFITDSGGMQKSILFKNTIILRDETEWSELIQTKVSILMSLSKLEKLDIEKINFNKDFSVPIYGSGSTGKLVIELLKSLKILISLYIICYNLA